MNHDQCEELAFPYLLPTLKFDYKVKREVPLCPVKYFNQRLLNFRQSFASNADYIFLEIIFSLYFFAEQHHLRSLIDNSLHKVQGTQLTVGSVRQNYKVSVKGLLFNENTFHFMSPGKGTAAYWKQFLHEVVAVVK